MIVTGAWWDYVDELASRRLGPLLRRYPLAMRRKMIAWRKSKGFWKRRSAILCQLGFKLSSTIAPGRGFVADLFVVSRCSLLGVQRPQISLITFSSSTAFP